MAVGETIQNTKTFIEESHAEMQKVTWPDQEQLKNATLVVVAFTIAISLVIWFMDVVVRFFVDQIMAIFGA